MDHNIMWNHIQDKQPEHGESIIHLDNPYSGHCMMMMRDYNQMCTWKELMKFNADNDLPPFDFWWISSKDFPFPKDERFKDAQG